MASLGRLVSETADAESVNRALVLASRQKSRFDRANLVIRSVVVLAVEVLGGLAVRLVHLSCLAVDRLELSLLGAEGNVV